MAFGFITTCLIAAGLCSTLSKAQEKRPFIYQPPSWWGECAVDPTTGSFIFLDAASGQPLVFWQGNIEVASFTEQSQPNFNWYLNFTKPDSWGLSDLVLHDPTIPFPLYLTVYDDGFLGFEPRSSGGRNWTPASLGSRNYVSTVWTLECRGKLRGGIPEEGGFEFDFFVKDNKVVTYPNQQGGVAGFALAYDVLRDGPLRPLRESEINRTEPVQDESSRAAFARMGKRQSFTNPFGRCPRGQSARERPGAPPPGANGCGPEVMPFNADGPFKQCCDGHDRCFDDCDEGFFGCNSDFGFCMYNTCNQRFPTGVSIVGDARNFGCHLHGQYYLSWVYSAVGPILYHRAGQNRCECGCPEGQVKLQTGEWDECREQCPDGFEDVDGHCEQRTPCDELQPAQCCQFEPQPGWCCLC